MSDTPAFRLEALRAAQSLCPSSAAALVEAAATIHAFLISGDAPAADPKPTRSTKPKDEPKAEPAKVEEKTEPAAGFAADGSEITPAAFKAAVVAALEAGVPEDKVAEALAPATGVSKVEASRYADVLEKLSALTPKKGSVLDD